MGVIFITAADAAAAPDVEAAGREDALADIEQHGFNYAYEYVQAVVSEPMFVNLARNTVWLYHTAYHQAVMGYWMAKL